MANHKRAHSSVKAELHPRNKHRSRYDLQLLVKSCPELAEFIIVNKYGDDSIDFFNADAVELLNKSLLFHYYGLTFWDLPAKFLRPAIPGRADYIHHVADLLASSNLGKIPRGSQINCLDVGIGASCIYPIIGNKEYHWSFVGSDIDNGALEVAEKIIQSNTNLTKHVETRFQKSSKDIFRGIILKNERFDLSICNPPFHASAEEAQEVSLRKLSNLKQKKISSPDPNFGGKSNELWTDGGEKKFVLNMIEQSAEYASSCFWFSTIISKEKNLDAIYRALERRKVKLFKTLPMAQGNKTSRIVAWTFLSDSEQRKWAKDRWRS